MLKNIKRNWILLSCFLFISGLLHAQTLPKMDLNLKNVTLKEFFSTIEKQSDYTFMFNNIDLNQSVTIKVKQTNLNDILKSVLTPKGIAYEIDFKRIILNGRNVAGENSGSQSQKTMITGVVTEKSTGEPLVGVNVSVKGTTNGTTTDIDGSYALQNVPANAVLEFSYIGMVTKIATVGNQSRIDVIMDENNVDLEEIVIVGYTGVKRGLLTGSVASMTVTETLENIPTPSAGTMLSGALAGVNVSSPNSYPGAKQPVISIRTTSSWNDQKAIFVIDGIVTEDQSRFNNLSPNEIETITVLKDAAATAIYGSRSEGGVVVVTTKRGKVGKTSFKYSFNAGFDKRTKNAGRTSAVQAGELYTRINGSNDPAGWAWSQDEIDYFKNINGGWGYDQLETVWDTPTNMSHNLTASGGSEKIRFFTGFSYYNQQSFFKPINYDKYNFRLNVTADLTKDLQLYVGTAMNYNVTNSCTWDANDLYGKLLIWQPDQPVFTDGGQLIDYGWIANVGAAVTGDEGYKKSDYMNPTLQAHLTYNAPFLKGLSVKISYNQYFTDNLEKTFEKRYDMNVMKRSGTNGRIMSTKDEDIVGTKKMTRVGKENLYKKNTKGMGRQIDLQLLYDNRFGKHHVQGTFVYEWANSNYGAFYGKRETFPVYRIDQFWAAASDRTNTDGGGGKDDADIEDGRVSYIGQFNYDYAGKYLLNFSFREDGSMKFAPDERWGFFPGGSVGWVISEEDFFNKSIIDFLKLRASVGMTGNDAVGGWQWQQSYDSGKSAYFGESPSPSVGIKYGKIVNPYLTWEKSLSYNVAVDMNYLNHWSTTAEYWFRNTYDILGNIGNVLPTTFSRDMPDQNYGKVHAQGFDLSIGYKGSTSDFGYYANLAMSYGWNKVIEQAEVQNPKEKDKKVGRAITKDGIATSCIYGFVFDKIIRTQEELDAFNTANPDYKLSGYKPTLGMMVYKDVSGPDGKPDGIIDDWDQVLLRDGNFPVVYGLNLGATWKGFALDMMFSGKINETKSFKGLADNVEWNRNWVKWYDDSWTPDNPNAMLPKRYSSNDGTNTTYRRTSAFWLKDVSFVRLKYVNLSYTIPPKLYNGVFDRVKVFFSGTNLFCLSNFSYYDPEVGGGFEYPIMRSFNFGIDVSF